MKLLFFFFTNLSWLLKSPRNFTIINLTRNFVFPLSCSEKERSKRLAQYHVGYALFSLVRARGLWARGGVVSNSNRTFLVPLSGFKSLQSLDPMKRKRNQKS